MDVDGVQVGGGYDRGYASCPMFWPDTPGSLLLQLDQAGEMSGGTALDVGCGEGTNAVWLSDHGYQVQGIDVSALALQHARTKYPHSDVTWTCADVTRLKPERSQHDVVIAYGLLHCIPAPSLEETLHRLRDWVAPGGLLVIVTFNDRSQDLELAHSGFHPTLRPHSFFLHAVNGWELLHASDRDLHESHPDTAIPHHHSMTRIVARRPNE